MLSKPVWEFHLVDGRSCIFINLHLTINMIWKVAILLLWLSMAYADNADCTYSPSDNVHFDLSPLKNDEADYYVFDRLSSSLNRT